MIRLDLLVEMLGHRVAINLGPVQPLSNKLIERIADRDYEVDTDGWRAAKARADSAEEERRAAAAQSAQALREEVQGIVEAMAVSVDQARADCARATVLREAAECDKQQLKEQQASLIHDLRCAEMALANAVAHNTRSARS